MCWIKQFHCNALRAKSFMRTKSFVMSKVNLKLLRASITSYNEPILVYNKSRWRRVKNTSHIFYFIETQQAESSRVDEKKESPLQTSLKVEVFESKRIARTARLFGVFGLSKSAI